MAIASDRIIAFVTIILCQISSLTLRRNAFPSVLVIAATARVLSKTTSTDVNVTMVGQEGIAINRLYALQ